MRYSASEFSRCFTSLCESRGLSPRRTLKDVFGMDGSNLQKWRNDESMPRADLLLAVAEYFEVSTEYLYGRSLKVEANSLYDLKPEEKQIVTLLRQADSQQVKTAIRVLKVLLEADKESGDE